MVQRNPVRQKVAEYEEKRAQGNAFGAILILAELWNYLSANAKDFDPSIQSVRAIQQPLSESDRDQVRVEAAKIAGKLSRILSVGTEFIYEEAVLLLTFRT